MNVICKLFFKPPVAGIISPRTSTIIPTCSASTGLKGNTKNKRKKYRGYKRGIRSADGDTVHPTYVLATQRLAYKYFPGANVYVESDMTLRSSCSGKVHYTKEVFIPHPDTEAGQAVSDMPLGSVMFKTFINVIPDQGQERTMFKLIETI